MCYSLLQIWLVMCIFWCFRLRVVCQQESPAVPLVSFQTPTNEFLLYSRWPAQQALNGKPQRHWLFSLHVLTEMEMSLSSFLMGFVRLCVIMNALFLTSCPAHPYPSPLSVSLCLLLSLSLSLSPSLTCSLISCLSLHLVELKAKTLRPGCSTDESSACSPMTLCFWFVCYRLKTETGNSRRSWSWLNRSCSKPSARPRLCLRWRPSSLRG